jgi:pyrroloquinoline quinone (PQQ) biosynthesis protein C
MATLTNKTFVDGLISGIIQPGVDDLMDSRYFRDLRAGKLTVRRMQGFAIQHYIHNMGVLKLAVLGAAQHAVDNKAFMAYAGLLNDEFTHPNMSKIFGFSLGLTDEDFETALPTYGAFVHTAACLHATYLASVAVMRAMALSNETMVQRYAFEFDKYLAKQPYNIPKKARTFFIVHKGADVEHTKAGAIAVAELATTDEEQERVSAMCRHMAKLKLGKFDSIYDEYV